MAWRFLARSVRSANARTLTLLFLLVASAGCSSNSDGTSHASDGGNSSGGNASGGRDSGGGSNSGGGQSVTAGTSTSSPSPDAQTYVDAHNAVRAAVEEPAGYTGTWQPLPPVSWSDEVAASAQQWADHLQSTMGCGLMHASGTGYGENLAGGTRLDAKGAVDLWAAEKKDYTYSPKYAFMTNTGHYTQIVWRKTTQIGCGSATCGNNSVVVCRYNPPGNYIGEQIF